MTAQPRHARHHRYSTVHAAAVLTAIGVFLAAVFLLMCAKPEDRPAMARKAADRMEQDPDGYNDGQYLALIGDLRKWATEQEQAARETSR